MQASNYFFLVHFCKRIEGILKGKSIERVVAVSANEIVFYIDGFKLRFLFLRGNSIFNFEEQKDDFVKGRILFANSYSSSVLSVQPVLYDRSFLIKTEAGVFYIRLYGTNGNVLFFESGKQKPEIFRNNIEADRTASLPVDVPPRDLVAELSAVPAGDRKAQFSFIPPEFFVALNDKLIAERIAEMNRENFYLYKTDESADLSFFRKDAKAVIFNNAVVAANEYFRVIASTYFYKEKRNSLEQKLKAFEKKANQLFNSARLKLEHIRTRYPDEQKGHLIMAYLHEIKKGMQTVSLPDFETGTPIEIRLKKDLSPAENAEYYYKRSKSEFLEESVVEEQLAEGQRRMDKAAEMRADFEKAEDFRALKSFEQKYFPKNLPAEKEENFRRFEVEGFSIYAGKSADNNDELTMKFAHKNDTWLHASHVSGSHVIIRNPENKLIPEKIILVAAGIAAYYSKSKSSSMVNVIVTQKKFIRKPKGANPGSVSVEQGRTVMVEAKLPD